MTDEIDYSSLPLEERLVHKVWKVRLQSYDELAEKFEKSRSENDAIFHDFGDVETYKKAVLDANVVAQESGYKLLCAFLNYGGTAQFVNKAKALVPSICEKGLSSSRKNTKELAIESILLLVELADKPDTIVEEILPSLSNRLPKLVAGCVTCLGEIVKNFGCNVISAKPIIAALPKLFAHADRTVRAETTKLSAELYVWIGDALPSLIPDLKPVQQKELAKVFEEVSSTKPQQLRFTRKQLLEQKKQENQTNAGGQNDDLDVEMKDAAAEVEFDPLQFVDPVEVLSKLPLDLNSRIASAKWKDRKEVLEEVVAVLEKAVKIVPNEDYSNLLRLLAKCMKDANIQVVQLAGNCIEYLVKGLKKDFTSNYKSLVLAPIIERTKEKKASVADALNSCLDAIFSVCGLSSILDDTLVGMQNKTPQIKIASTNYLQRCLAATTTAPTTHEIDNIMALGVKLLSESAEPIRQAATEMIGTLMKITGERELSGFLEKVDDNRKAKVKTFYETVQVQAKSAVPSQSRSSASGIPSTKSLLKPETKLFDSSSTARKSGPASTLPVKRTATSPAKRTDPLKQSTYGRGLTGRSLTQLSSSSTILRPKIASPAPTKMEVDLSPEVEKLQREINQLNQEKQAWLAQKQNYEQAEAKLRQEQASHASELSRLQGKYEELQRDYTNSTMLIKQKDTQINRLNNDLDGEKLKNKDLEQQIEMMKLQQNKKSYTNSTYNFNPLPVAKESETASPEVSQRISSGDLSSRVNRLSIEGSLGQREPNFMSSNNYNRYETPKRTQFTPTKSTLDFDGNDDSWKRAAEVTSQLKARIEKMKARSRGNSNFQA